MVFGGVVIVLPLVVAVPEVVVVFVVQVVVGFAFPLGLGFSICWICTVEIMKFQLRSCDAER